MRLNPVTSWFSYIYIYWRTWGFKVSYFQFETLFGFGGFFNAKLPRFVFSEIYVSKSIVE